MAHLPLPLPRILLVIFFLSFILSPAPERSASAASIPLTGRILNENGDVADIAAQVRALSADGSASYATQAAAGSYTLNLPPGGWWVRALPDLDSSCVPAESPRWVIIPEGAAAVTQDLRIALADRLVLGLLVDSHGSPVGVPAGLAFALSEQGSRWLQPGASAPVVTSSGVSRFLLRLPSSISTQYVLHVALPMSTGYTQVVPVPVDLSAESTNPIQVIIPLAKNNSHITGRVIDRATHQPIPGLPAWVFGGSNTGAVAQVQVNTTGSYRLDLATANLPGLGGSTWWLHAALGPGLSYAMVGPRLRQVFLPYNGGSGASAQVDFTAARVDSTITGQVRLPGSIPASGALVTATSADGDASDFRAWAAADDQGNYRLSVPAGRYRLRAGDSFAQPAPLSPTPLVVEAPAGQTIAAPDLQFRGWDGNVRITGTVTYKGSPRAALVRASSDTGARTSAQAGADGMYSLPAPGGETWHVQAAGANAQATQFLISPRSVVVTPNSGMVTANLAMQTNEPLIETGIFRFDATTGQVLTLSHGGQILIPAGTIPFSDMASIAVIPLPHVADDGGIEPVSFGYRLLAFDDSGQPVTLFKEYVTLRLPFTGEQLTGQGLGPDQLMPYTYNPATATWIPLPNFSIEMEPDQDGDGVVVVQVDRAGDYVNMVDSLPYRVYAPGTKR